VAAFLVHRLYSVLGTHSGEDSAKGPIARPAPVSSDDWTQGSENQPMTLAQQQILNELPEDAPTSLEETLIAIARMDQSFDLKKFKEGAADAYEYIVKAYTNGERDILRALLAPPLYENFEFGIQQREEAGQTAFTEIRAIKSTDIIDARLERKTAFLTVKFVAEELSYTENVDGKIIEGSKSRTADLTDIWTFSRDLRSSDPNWILVETRSGE